MLLCQLTYVKTIDDGGDVAKDQIEGFYFLTHKICFERESCACLLACTQACFALKTVVFAKDNQCECFYKTLLQTSFPELFSLGLFCSMGNTNSCAFMKHLCFCY